MARRRTRFWLGGLAALLAIGGIVWRDASAQTPAGAQESGALLRDTFDADTKGWIAQGPNGKVQVTTDADHVKTGHGALEFSYVVGDKSGKQTPAKPTPGILPFDVLSRLTPNGALA